MMEILTGRAPVDSTASHLFVVDWVGQQLCPSQYQFAVWLLIEPMLQESADHVVPCETGSPRKQK